MRCATILAAVLLITAPQSRAAADPLPGTKPLEMQGDLAEQMVAGIDRFLLSEIAESVGKRPRHWKRDASSPAKYNESVAPNRARLAKMIGAADPREKVDGDRAARHHLASRRWSAAAKTSRRLPCAGRPCGACTARGCCWCPSSSRPWPTWWPFPTPIKRPSNWRAAPGIAPESQFARRLAESGCRVLIPALDRSGRRRCRPFRVARRISRIASFCIGRRSKWAGTSSATKCKRSWPPSIGSPTTPARAIAAIGVIGYGEGGLLALVRRRARPAHRRGDGQRLLRLAAESVAGADLSQRVRAARPVWRCRAGQPGRSAGADRRSLPRAAGQRSAAAARRPATLPPRPACWPRPALATRAGRSSIARRALVAALAMPRPFELVASGTGDGPPGSAAALCKSCWRRWRRAPSWPRSRRRPRIVGTIARRDRTAAPLVRPDQRRHAARAARVGVRPGRILVESRSRFARLREMAGLDAAVSRAVLQRSDRPLRSPAAAAQSALAADLRRAAVHRL